MSSLKVTTGILLGGMSSMLLVGATQCAAWRGFSWLLMVCWFWSECDLLYKFVLCVCVFGGRLKKKWLWNTGKCYWWLCVMGWTQEKKKNWVGAHLETCMHSHTHIHFDTILLYTSRAIIHLHAEGLLAAIIGRISGIVQLWWLDSCGPASQVV